MGEVTWTQPICVRHWNERFPTRAVNPNDPKYWYAPLGDPCCFCDKLTRIYIRIDPSTVPFPREV